MDETNRNQGPKKFHVRTTDLEDFHKSCDIELGVQGKVVNVGDEVGDLLFKEMESLLNLIQGVFVAVINTFVVVIGSLVDVVTTRFLRLSVVGSMARRAIRVV